MWTIQQKELRNNVADVLRRAEAGDGDRELLAGRPVARLGPAAKRRWASGPALRDVFQTPTPQTLDEDLERFPAGVADPFA